MVCEHSGKPFYERKKELFRQWYWKNKANTDFREKIKENSRNAYKKSKENLNVLKDINKELERQNDILRGMVEDLKEIIEFDLKEFEENNEKKI